MRQRMFKRVLFYAAALSIVGLLAAGCGGGKQQPSEKNTGDAGFPRAKTLYLGGDQWGEPNTFNPLCDWPSWPIRGKDNIMYEPLMTYNSLTGAMEPLLGHSLEKSPEVISV